MPKRLVLASLPWVLVCLGCALRATIDLTGGQPERHQSFRATVEIEELFYEFVPAQNGASPMWSNGSTSIVRVGERVYATGLETLAGRTPLNNVRWLLHERRDAGWRQIHADELFTREPSPIGTDGERVYVSTNPEVATASENGGSAVPGIEAFALPELERLPTLQPDWSGAPVFGAHSYRGFSVDPDRGDLFLSNTPGYDVMYWSYRNREGRWEAAGAIPFPFGHEYARPQTIRLCYPAIALQDRAVHVLAISDIKEPVEEWARARRETGRAHHRYDFRRLFYTWTPDVAKSPFEPWQEIASVEATAGKIFNLDVLVDEAGRTHLLWLERSLDLLLRDRFFPGQPLVVTLNYAVFDHGREVRRETLVRGSEDSHERIPVWGRLHESADGRIFLLFHATTTHSTRTRTSLSANYLLEIYEGRGHGAPLTLAVDVPLSRFMTAAKRSGTRPSNTLDVLGMGGPRSQIRYLRIRLD